MSVNTYCDWCGAEMPHTTNLTFCPKCGMGGYLVERSEPTKITVKDLDEAVEALWVEIWQLVELSGNEYAVSDIKEAISQQIIEISNLAFSRGIQHQKSK